MVEMKQLTENLYLDWEKKTFANLYVIMLGFQKLFKLYVNDS